MWWTENPSLFNKEYSDLINYKKIQVEFFFADRVYGFGSDQFCTGHHDGVKKHVVVATTIVTAFNKPHQIILVYPCLYPALIASVWADVNSGFGHQHRNEELGKSKLCLTGNEYDSSINGLTVLNWAYAWLMCHDIWEATGKRFEGNLESISI
jgi:hypothetical protein